MSNSTSPEMNDPSSFVLLDKVERETGLPDIPILSYSLEVLLDCTSVEPSCVWMWTGIAEVSAKCQILDCFSENPEKSSLGDFVIASSTNTVLLYCIT